MIYVRSRSATDASALSSQSIANATETLCRIHGCNLRHGSGRSMLRGTTLQALH